MARPRVIRRDAPTDGPKALRALLDHEPIIRCLGAHDVLAARLIERAGMECIFLGGFGGSASLLGLPDMNLLTLTDMTQVANRVANAVNVPIIVDGDTGHGDLHNVQRTIREFEQAGAAGVLIEDQIVPKRCGHFEGKQVIPAREMCLKIRAAIDARENHDLVLIARTDARSAHGLEDAITRACMYGEAGADMVYIEAPSSEEELVRITRQVPYSLMINMLTGGKTPSKSLSELRELGFKVALWPIESVLVTARAIERLTRALVENGRLDAMAGDMVSFTEIQDLLGLPGLLDLRGRMERGLDGKA
jgi:2-methylisocitrate lyase-like PEP mutase family enzyme